MALDLFLLGAFGAVSPASERRHTFTDSQNVASVGHCCGSVEYTVELVDGTTVVPTIKPTTSETATSTTARRIFQRFSDIKRDAFKRKIFLHRKLSFRQTSNGGRP